MHAEKSREAALFLGEMHYGSSGGGYGNSDFDREGPTGLTMSEASQHVELPITGNKTAGTAIPATVDFAHWAGNQVLVYGWIVGLGQAALAAFIQIGTRVVPLVEEAIRVRRPDVARHFSLDDGDDEHGFYALIDVEDTASAVEQLRLIVVQPSGETTESLWPVHATEPPILLQPYAVTIRNLMRHLPTQETKRLGKFLALQLGASMDLEELDALPPPIEFHLELGCVLEDRILVVFGSLSDPASEVDSFQLRVGDTTIDLRTEAQWRTPANRSASREGKVGPSNTFIYAAALPEQHSEGWDAGFSFTVRGYGRVRLRKAILWSRCDARQQLISVLHKTEADSALVAIEAMQTTIAESSEPQTLQALLQYEHRSGVERLPSSLEDSALRYAFHIDQVVSIAERGVILLGWCHTKANLDLRVICHSGKGTFNVSDRWIRHVRPDVASHLANLGIRSQQQEHGFTCFVPLKDRRDHYYLSILLPSGEVCRISSPIPETPEPALQLVRTLLSFFSSQRSDLVALLDDQVGPAVQAVWAARETPKPKVTVRYFGERPAEPAVTVIVPLYGRSDLAEYQLALFAGDREFQSIELMYVVDDPSILEAFVTRCEDLYGIYRVPFTVSSPGVNLGFAGANNFGAEAARGRYLLFLNSDVMPKRHGWVSELVETHARLDRPGITGARLLYEDGSVQHAGIAFQRYAPWGGLWINTHPLKGQSVPGLHGLREVDAVTAACALVEADFYRELGGFSEDYIIGDFEDSDLCLRAQLAGRRNHVNLDVELYHLERQSQNLIGDLAWRTNLTIYNCWLHNRRWSHRFETQAVHHHPSAPGTELEIGVPAVTGK